MYETDHEQGEAIKQWLAQWGIYVVLGILALGGALLGSNLYRDAAEANRQAASEAFVEVIEEVSSENPDTDAAQAAIDALKAEFPDTAYAFLGQLFEAKFAMQAGEPDEAVVLLNDAINNAPTDELADIAEVRLARVHYHSGNYEQALTKLEAVPSQQAMAAELRGDILVAQGNVGEAIAAYQQAIDLGQNLPRTQIVQLKLNNLSGE